MVVAGHSGDHGGESSTASLLGPADKPSHGTRLSKSGAAITAAPAPPQSGLLGTLRKQWFLVGLLLSILLAKLAPWIGARGGPLLPELTVRFGAVPLIFFNSGLTINSEEMVRAVRNVRLHLLVQGFTFGLVPIAMSLVVPLLEEYSTLNAFLLKGLLVVACMPPPVSSAVILSKVVGANDAAAVFNSVLGSLLGVFVTPALLLSLVGVQSSVPVSAIVASLMLTVVAPIVVGQLVRVRWWQAAPRLREVPFRTISTCTLLVIIYTTFCDTFAGDVDVDARSLVFVAAFVVVLQVAEMLLLFAFSTQLGFPPADVVCILWCGSHKSLTLGIPMLNIVFSGSPALSLVCVPLLVYVPTQILLGGLMVPYLRGSYLPLPGEGEGDEEGEGGEEGLGVEGALESESWRARGGDSSGAEGSGGGGGGGGGGV